jgi:hypothetical protein
VAEYKWLVKVSAGKENEAVGTKGDHQRIIEPSGCWAPIPAQRAVKNLLAMQIAIAYAKANIESFTPLMTSGMKLLFSKLGIEKMFIDRSNSRALTLFAPRVFARNCM